jgi:hypothetical protein
MTAACHTRGNDSRLAEQKDEPIVKASTNQPQVEYLEKRLVGLHRDLKALKTLVARQQRQIQFLITTAVDDLPLPTPTNALFGPPAKKAVTQ